MTDVCIGCCPFKFKNKWSITLTVLPPLPVQMTGRGMAVRLMQSAMEEYAEQFKYDYSQSCKCTDSTGSTYCCNICGKPLDNNSPSNTEVKIIEKMQAMCIESLSPDTFEKWESVKEWLIKTRSIK